MLYRELKQKPFCFHPWNNFTYIKLSYSGSCCLKSSFFPGETFVNIWYGFYDWQRLLKRLHASFCFCTFVSIFSHSFSARFLHSNIFAQALKFLQTFGASRNKIPISFYLPYFYWDSCRTWKNVIRFKIYETFIV